MSHGQETMSDNTGVCEKRSDVNTLFSHFFQFLSFLLLSLKNFVLFILQSLYFIVTWSFFQPISFISLRRSFFKFHSKFESRFFFATTHCLLVQYVIYKRKLSHALFVLRHSLKMQYSTEPKRKPRCLTLS